MGEAVSASVGAQLSATAPSTPNKADAAATTFPRVTIAILVSPSRSRRDDSGEHWTQRRRYRTSRLDARPRTGAGAGEEEQVALLAQYDSEFPFGWSARRRTPGRPMPAGSSGVEAR